VINVDLVLCMLLLLHLCSMSFEHFSWRVLRCRSWSTMTQQRHHHQHKTLYNLMIGLESTLYEPSFGYQSPVSERCSLFLQAPEWTLTCLQSIQERPLLLRVVILWVTWPAEPTPSFPSSNICCQLAPCLSTMDYEMRDVTMHYWSGFGLVTRAVVSVWKMPVKSSETSISLLQPVSEIISQFCFLVSFAHQ